MRSLPGGGYEIRARGKFSMKQFSSAGNCAMWVDVTVRTGPNQSSVLTFDSTANGQNVAATAGPQSTATALAPDGLSLRQLTLGLRCKPGWAIGTTGFFLTGIEGQIQLATKIEQVTVKFWIDHKTPCGNVPCVSMVPKVTLIPDPFYLGLDGPVYFINTQVVSSHAEITAGRFYAEVQIDYLVLHGGMTIEALSRGGKFSVEGSGWGEISLRKGEVVDECISYPSPTLSDPRRKKTICLSVPDSNITLARADAHFDLDGIEVSTKIAGYRVKAYFDFHSHSLAVDTGVLASMVTSAQIAEARQIWSARQRGEVVAAALDPRFSFARGGELLITMPITPTTPTLQAANVITTYSTSHQQDALFALVQPLTSTLEFQLIDPNGLTITPGSLPANVTYSQTVGISETQSLYIVGQAAIGDWKTHVVGNTEQIPFMVLYKLSDPPPALQALQLIASGNPNQVQAQWALLAAEGDTHINIYAQSGPLTTTVAYTDAEGIKVEEVVDLFAGTPLAEALASSVDGAPQSHPLDLSQLPSGQYAVWIEAVSPKGGRSRCYIRQATTACDSNGGAPILVTVNHNADFPTAWTPVITPTLDIKMGEMILTWDRIPHPDMDSYTVYVSNSHPFSPTLAAQRTYTVAASSEALASLLISNVGFRLRVCNRDAGQ